MTASPTPSRRPRLPARIGRLALAFVALLVLAGAIGVGVDWWVALPPQTTAVYVGSSSCFGCHATQASQWRGSHHERAMDFATPHSVLGDFDEVTFTAHGVESRLFRRDEDYFITTDGPDGTLQTYRIKYTFGWEPLQQYLVEFDDGRVQALPIAWDTQRRQWFHLYPGGTDFQSVRDVRTESPYHYADELHWTRPAQNWNFMCADCHSVDVHMRFDGALNRFDTTFAEISVGCEACHGPGSVHVDLAESWSLFWDRHFGKGLTVTLKESEPDRPRSRPLGTRSREIAEMEFNTCVKCHALRAPLYPGFEPGGLFLDYYAPELLDSEMYFPDGQIHEEVFEYGSFLQSRMYHEGVRCSDCHEPHTARLIATGNNLCIRCHEAEKYDTPLHHHHLPFSPGASCIECHMPQKTYMVVDPRRDHSFRIPRPDLTIELGVPNTCNECHDGQSPQWARDVIAEWTSQTLDPREHYGFAIAGGRAGRTEAEGHLIAVVNCDETPGFVRASAVSLLRQYRSEASRTTVERALSDDDPLVRWAAVQAVVHLVNDPSALLVPRLDDPIRLVRLEAVQALTAFAAQLTPVQRERFDAVFAEYERGQLAVAEPLAARLNLGQAYAALGEADRARAFYNEGLRIDPSSAALRHRLAMLEYELGDREKVEGLLRSVIALAPSDPEGHISLGLFLGEDPARMEEAAHHLGESARLAPDRADVHHQHGLSLQHLRRMDEAERALKRAVELEPQEPAFLYALVVLNLQQEPWDAALEWVDRLIASEPDNPEWVRLRRQIEGR